MLSYRCRVLFGIIVLSLSSLSSAEKLLLTIASASGEERGVVTIDLYEHRAPNHVARIKQLAGEGKYNGVVFHRVIAGFMAQTGDVQFGNMKKLSSSNVGTGGSSYDDLKAEFSELPFVEGVVGMARSRYIHSANSQFFIMTDTHSSLNGQYTVIGAVTDGMNVVHRIKKGAGQSGKVNAPDIIKTAVVVQ
jgi:cyclophilin family peptidyl-prolyl cis-trans isomerase